MAAPTIRLNEMKTEDPATKWTAGAVETILSSFPDDRLRQNICAVKADV